MKTYFALLVLGAASFAFGQGAFVPPQVAFRVVNGYTSPIANATITVCAAATGGIPCSPVLTNSIFQDEALTESLPNPFTTDALGNYQFAAAVNTYTVTVTTAGFAGYSYQISVANGSGGAGGWNPPDPANFPGAVNIPGPLNIGSFSAIDMNPTDFCTYYGTGTQDQLQDLRGMPVFNNFGNGGPCFAFLLVKYSDYMNTNPPPDGTIATWNAARGQFEFNKNAFISPAGNLTVTGCTGCGGGGGGIGYPPAGVPVSLGTGWSTSLSTTGTGNVVLSGSPTLTGTVTLGAGGVALNGSSVVLGATGIFATDAFSNLLSMQSSEIALAYLGGGSGNAAVSLSNAAGGGAQISDGSGNALILGNSAGARPWNLNLTNVNITSGLINTTSSTSYLYGSPLNIGVNPTPGGLGSPCPGFAIATTGITACGKFITAASATAGAGFNLPAGTAPTSPVNGDVWTTSAGMFAQIAGSTVGPFGISTGLTNPMTGVGDMIEGGTAGAPARLASPSGSSGVPLNLTCTPPSCTPGWFPVHVTLRASTCAVSNSDALVAADRNGYVTESDSSTCSVSIAAAGSTGFGGFYETFVCNIGTGQVNINPTTSTISYTTGSGYVSAASTMPLLTGQCADIKSNNANYSANLFAMIYPPAGVPLSTGSGYGTSYTVSGTGTVLAAAAGATLTPVSLIASGINDGEAPITLTTGSSATLGGTYSSGYTYNQEATAATAVTYTLPTAAAGKQYCIKNSYNGSAADTGVLELITSASGQFIILNGALSATNGFIVSSGAAGDSLCVVGIDATHWEAYPQVGAWVLH